MRIMKANTFLIIITFTLFWACNQKVSKSISTIDSSLLLKHWIHYHEGDAQNQKVYKPKGYDFPLSRGREAYHIHSDGGLVHYRISPNDLIIPVEGSWEVTNDSIILVKYMNNKFPPDTLVVIEISSDLSEGYHSTKLSC